MTASAPPPPDHLRRSAEDKGGGLIGWDHGWQFPAETEAHAWRRLQGVTPAEGVFYIGYPWATLIDKTLIGTPDAAAHQAQFAAFCAALPPARDRVTVCQQIHLRRFPDFFAQAGITRLFWSHATPRDLAAGIGTMEVRPFPLYPVQIPAASAGQDQPWLYSFIGARATLFNPGQTRDWILADLADDPRGLVRGRRRWHYNRIVYDHQIRRTAAAEGLVDLQAEAEFRSALAQSIFALCPAGTGPNSIRLWEALGAGAIPVILADDWAPPGTGPDPGSALRQSLWQQGAVFVPETRAAIRDLPSRLAGLAADPARLAAMRSAGRLLWRRYGPDDFIPDVAAVLTDPPPPGPRHPHWQAGQMPMPAPMPTPHPDWPAAVVNVNSPNSHDRSPGKMPDKSPDPTVTKAKAKAKGERKRRQAATAAALPATAQNVIPNSQIPQPAQIPLASEAVFWQPRHALPSADLPYLPFLFWLVESLRPHQVTQLGLGDMTAYLGLCQAVDKLGLKALCLGQDPGCPATLPARALAIHASHYADFSQLIATDAESAAPLSPEAGIDLLVMGPPPAGATPGLRDRRWLPHLSQRGVVVILEQDGRQNGLAMALAALTADRIGAPPAHITLDHGSAALHLLLVGPDQPERLRSFVALAPGDEAYRMSRQVFRRLGLGLDPDIETLTQRLAEEQRARQQLEARLAGLPAGQDTAPTGRDPDLVQAEAALTEMLQRLDAADRSAAEARNALTGSEQALAETRARLDDACHERDLARADSAGVRQSTSWRITAPIRAIKRFMTAARS